ncbi:MAG: XRE family transcriptional regulator [Hymenobacter sp.]|nr:MAG: XRE family transcriptional regulator [Hymenobacter sp.]
MPDLSRIFIRYRLKLGLTQQEVAELSEVSVRLLRELEAGRANPGLRQLERIAKVLNLTLTLVPLTNENIVR